MQWMRHVKWGRWVSNFFISGILVVAFIQLPDFLVSWLKHTGPGSFLVPYFVVSYLLFLVMLPKSPHKLRFYYALSTTGTCLVLILLFMLLMFALMLISALLFDSFSSGTVLWSGIDYTSKGKVISSSTPSETGLSTVHHFSDPLAHVETFVMPPFTSDNR